MATVLRSPTRFSVFSRSVPAVPITGALSPYFFASLRKIAVSASYRQAMTKSGFACLILRVWAVESVWPRSKATSITGLMFFDARYSVAGPQ